MPVGKKTDELKRERAGADEKVDLQALARKVYKLLKEEARVERERLGRRHTW